MAEVRQATLEDAYSLAPRLRKEDAEEIAASSGGTPLAALLAGLRFSSTCNVLIHDGAPIAMGGVCPLVPGAGAVWLLGSPDIASIRYEFLRISRGWVDEMHGTEFPVLTNVVDARNAVHIKWLKWCGFTFLKRHERWGSQGLPFYEFLRVRNV